MRKLMWSLLALAGMATAVQAVPIVYQQPVIPAGGTVNGVNGQSPGNSSNPVGATYHYFFANAGSLVNVFGDRQAGFYDMSFYVFSGMYADTNDFGGSFPGTQGANFIGFGDDQDPANIPGPFGDPHITFNAPVTGFYTIAVTNFLSGAGGPPNPYTLTVTGNANPVVPEPISLVVFGGLIVGGAGIALRRRMTKATA